jgi:ComF family protein
MRIDWHSALGFCLPSMCLSCQMPLSHRGCCLDCYQRLPWLGSCCPRCAQPMDASDLCGRCLISPPAFRRAVIPFVYDFPISHWLAAFKFHEQLDYGVFLADCLWQRLQPTYEASDWPQALIAVPLHRQRLQRRGYNQALLIAARLAHLSGIALARRAVIKTRATVPQTTLSKSLRLKSVRRVFTVVKPVASHVAIIDDILTTGATVQELARTLLRSGVRQVDVWCVARTILH